jgi:hypothetical protein
LFAKGFPMWHDAYLAYVERHLRFYFELPEGVEFHYGQPQQEGSAALRIPDRGRSFFNGEGGLEPEFEVVDGLPLLFKEPNTPLLQKTGEGWQITADLIAGIFYFMSGWQERHQGDRFYHTDSWQGRHGFEKQPLADQYFELLAGALAQCYHTAVPRKKWHGAAVTLSHDIDKLYGGRLEGSFNELKKGFFLKALKGLTGRRDPWFNLSAIGQIEKELGVTATYFMLPRQGSHPQGENADYHYAHPAVQKEVAALREAGSEIALHGSLGTHVNAREFERDCAQLKEKALGNRFHFLHFNRQHTPELLENAKMQYDATIGFPDMIGFRNGMARPYKLFNFERNRIGETLEIPLHIMDTSLQHPKYMGLKPRAALEAMKSLFEISRAQQGVLSVLWHNNYFSDYKYQGWSAVYRDFIASLPADTAFYTAGELAQIYRAI